MPTRALLGVDIGTLSAKGGAFERLAEERGVAAPLLRALYRIVYGNRDVEQELRAACWGGATLRLSRPRRR